MSRQQAFEAIYAKQHDVPAESLVQYRFESKEGYSLPGIASHYRFYCLAMDSEEIQALRKDAERYRWLRQHEFDIGSYHPGHEHNASDWFEHIDGELIDRGISDESEFAADSTTKGEQP